jgi:hypothetical protein
MPVWAAVVIGLGSGVASGLLGTLLSISHQRGAEWRSRRLDAAAEFLRRAEEVRRLARRGPEGDPEFSLALVRRTWDELVPAVSMIELLYGYWSQPAHFAHVIGSELGDLTSATAAAVASEGEESALLEMQQHLRTASAAFDDFSRVAALDVRQGWLRRLPRRIAWRVELWQGARQHREHET